MRVGGSQKASLSQEHSRTLPECVIWVGDSAGNSDVLRSSDVTALEVLHVTGKYGDRSMQHKCSRHADWDPDA